MAAAGWHISDIKAALEKRGWTLSRLDAENSLPAGTCSFALRKPSQIGELVIAEALGRSPRELWPERYQQDGIRKRPQPAENYKNSPPSARSKKGPRGANKIATAHDSRVRA